MLVGMWSATLLQLFLVLQDAAFMSPSIQLLCSLNGTVDELPPFFERMEVWGEEHDVPPALIASFGLMLDELLTNVAMHAYQSKGGPVAVQIDFIAPAHLRALLRDEGPAYDPTAAAEVDVNAPIEEREIGGLGVHFVRNLADQFAYRRDGHVNEVLVSRTLPAKA